MSKNLAAESTLEVGPCSPFLIVEHLEESIQYYVDKLGFECRFKTPDKDPFFAIVGRGTAQLMLKEVGEDVKPCPNRERHTDAKWDVFIYVPDPDTLAEEFAARGVEFEKPVDNTSDGLRGFELFDPDGYVCFFGRPK